LVRQNHALSTFGDERVFNPYVSDFAAEEYEHLFEDPRYFPEGAAKLSLPD